MRRGRGRWEWRPCPKQPERWLVDGKLKIKKLVNLQKKSKFVSVKYCSEDKNHILSQFEKLVTWFQFKVHCAENIKTHNVSCKKSNYFFTLCTSSNLYQWCRRSQSLAGKSPQDKIGQLAPIAHSHCLLHFLIMEAHITFKLQITLLSQKVYANIKKRYGLKK